MILPNLNATLPLADNGSDKTAWPVSRFDATGDGAVGTDSSWSRILAGFEQSATGNEMPGEANASALMSSLREFQQSGGDNQVTSEGMFNQAGDLFGVLDGSQSYGTEPGTARELPASSLPAYDQAYWPSSGEMTLLLQGIDPWAGERTAEQSAWLEQVGPYVNIPELTKVYAGPTEVGRNFTVVNLAEAAGADPQRAFVDAWLGRNKSDVGRNAYEIRFAYAQERAALPPGSEPPAVGRQMAETPSLDRQLPQADSDEMPGSGRGVVFAQMPATRHDAFEPRMPEQQRSLTGLSGRLSGDQSDKIVESIDQAHRGVGPLDEFA